MCTMNSLVRRASLCHVYCDASVRNGLVGVGVVTLQDRRINKRSWRVLSDVRDVTFAELCGIYAAIMHIPRDTPIMLYTDSLDSLYMLRGYNVYKRTYHDTMLRFLHMALSRRTAFTVMHKVKAHSGVWGNEEADRMAKRATQNSIGGMPRARHWAL